MEEGGVGRNVERDILLIHTYIYIFVLKKLPLYILIPFSKGVKIIYFRKVLWIFIYGGHSVVHSVNKLYGKMKIWAKKQ